MRTKVANPLTNLLLIFTCKVKNPTNIDEYEIEVAEDKAYEEAYNHYQSVIQHSCLEDPFLSCK